jgi:hypothetical protein
MNWERTETKRGNMTTGELKLRLMLSEIQDIDWIHDAESFKRTYDERIQTVHVSGSYYQPKHTYRCKTVGESLVEVWKVSSAGEEIKKLYTINKTGHR